MLSNKLTFSLAFLVMLVCGLALLATPVEAQRYEASHSGTTWTVLVDIPVASNPVELAIVNNAAALRPQTALIEADTTDTDDGLSGITVTNVTAASTVAVSVIQSDDAATAADSVGNAAFVRYTLALTQSVSTDDPATDVDEGAVTFTVDGYGPVTLNTDEQTDGHDSTPLPAAIGVAGPNSIDFTLDTDVSRFHIVYNSAADESDTAIAGENLGNGIRIGAGYVPEGAVSPADLPDLAAFFAQGGSITLSGANGVFITEIMWGYDAMDGTGIPSPNNQWIEVYYGGAIDADDPAQLELTLRFVYNIVDRSGVDEISNIYLARWNPKGQSGRSGFSAIDGSAPIPVVSMHRTRGLNADGTYVNANFGNGVHDNQWGASQASVNMSGFFTGTPGAPHLTPTVGGGHADYAKSEVPGTPLQFSEVRNDGSRDNVDWIEIRNVSDAPVNLKDYEISLVTGVSRSDLQGRWDARGREVRRWGQLDADKKDPSGLEHDLAIVGEDKYYDQVNNDVKRFPDWMLPAGAYLLIVNRDPSETILAGGKDIEILANAAIDNKTTNKGSDVYYFVTPYLRFSNPGTSAAPLLVLRKRVDRNEFHGKVHGDGASIVDLAGAGRFADNTERAKYNFNTEVWPLRGWRNPGGSHNIAASNSIRNFVEGGNHEWWKHKGSASPGTGYDKGTPARLAVGTPGYPDGVVKDKLTDHKGTPDTTDDVTLLMGNISISEIMFDASVHAGNERWNLVQWIELYNSSMTEAINLKGWEFEIRNSNDHVDSFVDSSFIFKDLIVHPNQTVLLVSARAASGGIADRQIYNLFVEHARELGLANRRANLLSPAGFFLRLSYKANDGSNTKIVVDEAGNVAVNGRQRTTTEWAAIPPSEGAVRYSLVRQYGTRKPEGGPGGGMADGAGPDLPAVGTMEEAWIVADLDGEGATYFGQRGDIATPGFRTGGPLPVELSSFRPARDKATGEVVIRWITHSELNNAGFNILRSESKNGEFEVVNLKGIIPGHGTTSEKHVYEWKDTTAKPNVVYYYQIEDVSLDGNRTTLATTHLRGNVNAAGKVTTTWGDLKTQN